MDDKNLNNMTDELWRSAILPPDATIEQAISNLDQVAIKIVLVVNEQGKFVGTISDGDIRRGLLKGLGLDSQIKNVTYTKPLIVPPDMKRETVLKLMTVNKIQQIPVVDESLQVLGLHLWDNIVIQPTRSNLMVIMAGGKGTRLLPYTENCPKPMVMVSGKPILEHIIERGKLEGFSHFVLAINYLGHMIENYFGNGEDLGVQIDYLREQSALGTVGALTLLDHKPSDSFVVTNGDVITDIRYGDLLDFHNRHNAAATMAVRLHEWQHPFGVVLTQDIEVVGFEEKPIARSHINAGVYVLSPDALNELALNTACDMPSLFERLKDKSKRIIAYPMHEPWLDVGRPEDLYWANTNEV